ncbi:MAG: hypothetical protein P8Y12_10415, partial [Gammaproteobacteria bacterium]
MRLIQLTMAATLFFPAPLMAQQQGFLENPTDFSNESGIGVVSGFHCNAQIIEVILILPLPVVEYQVPDQSPITASINNSWVKSDGSIPTIPKFCLGSCQR